MIQVGRVVDESSEPPSPFNAPRLFPAWKATLQQLQFCHGIFQRIQQFVNQHPDLEDAFANPFQTFMGVHTPVYGTVTDALQELITPHQD
jgi:hypothetical protein